MLACGTLWVSFFELSILSYGLSVPTLILDSKALRAFFVRFLSLMKFIITMGSSSLYFESLVLRIDGDSG